MHMRPTPSEDEDMFVAIGQTNAALLQQTEAQNDTATLDDVFGSDDGVEEGQPETGQVTATHPTNAQHQHPSDIGRLQGEHTTAGYREGVTVAKAASVQAGFDEGFGLGAALGLEAGEIIGVLEGLAAAAAATDDADDGANDRERLATLLYEAREALAARSIFDSVYWDADGTWRYPVPGQESEEVVFKDVVEAHPLISRWRSITQDQMQQWGVDRDVFSNVGCGGDERGATEKPRAGMAQRPSTAAPAAPTAQQSRMSNNLQW